MNKSSHPWKAYGQKITDRILRADAQKETDSPPLESDLRRELFQTHGVISRAMALSRRTMEHI
jgi:hypothetical protein